MLKKIILNSFEFSTKMYWILTEFWLQEFWPNSDVKSSNGSVPRRSNLPTKAGTESAAALVERFDRRGIEPFELFRSEFGQNSWNPKKTTKSTVAKKTTSTKRHSTQNTRRGRTKGEKRETNCTEGARRTTLSHRSKRCYTCRQKMLCLKVKRGYACLQNMIEVPSARSRCE